jgi:LCP family protein required for cell wall assembly
MDKKYLIILLSLFLILGAFVSYIIFLDNPDGTKKEPTKAITEAIQKVTNPNKEEQIADKSFFKDKDVVNILLIGKDIGKERKSKGQTGYNTDTLILLSINPKQNKALLTSFPRDIWQNNSKINGILVTQGMDSLLDAMSKISGQKVEKYISIDFDGIRWLVNQFNGIPVNVETSFTDNSFPDNYDTRTMAVSFNKGVEIMDGERALTFARSRKGDNGEGSDLKRAKRQHLILKGMVNSVEKEDSKFFPFKIDEFYNEVIKNTETNVSLEDAYYVFSFYKNIKDYKIESLVLDDRYIYHPTDASPYGGAWVFIAKDTGFKKLHSDINEFLFTDVNPLSTQ